MPEHRIEGITAFLRLSDRIGTAGQPTADQFAAIREAGYRVVVNLRPPASNAPPDERALVEAQGMEYVSIPIVWEHPTLDDAAQFFATMDAHAQDKVFVHCAVNKRVSAFMYLYRVLRQNVPPETAEQDLRRIWTPEPTWQRFITEVLNCYRTGNDAFSA